MIEVEHYKPSTDKPGYLTFDRRATIGEVRAACDDVLRQADLYDQMESFGSFPALDEGQAWPAARWVAVFPVRGGSEGYYVHVEALAINDSNGRQTNQRQLILMGKTFEGIDTANKIANALTCAFHGD